MPELGELARVRSKNAGPFWLTVDLFCAEGAYERVAAIPTEAFAARLGWDAGKVRRFDLPALGVVKLSLPRPVVQGAFEDRDMHGAAWGAALEGMVV
ncbi:DUF4387 domain-containing protein [Jannaschia sp. W003]|uniref:DUF4387 domain-containing protein n=1 Tax=Jannaschia sp. W003 TaxID=2867012 RepID=UPI0021A52807|nr:DUF4387 domain-containing protein [Jannaschia sp. W003]UWQ21127.1 DUF4387 domain-containing protein [Jannaschia sp. W003]